jgi:hypothetical protein
MSSRSAASGHLLTGPTASLVGFQTGGPDTPMQWHQFSPTHEFLNQHFPSLDQGRGRVHLAWNPPPCRAGPLTHHPPATSASSVPVASSAPPASTVLLTFPAHRTPPLQRPPCCSTLPWPSLIASTVPSSHHDYLHCAARLHKDRDGCQVSRL